MNVHARARASAQAIDRSATRLDPVVGLDDLLRHRRRQPLQRAAVAALALVVVAVAIWAGAVLRGPTPIQPTLGPVTRFSVGPDPISVAVTPDGAWVLNSGDSTISRIDPGTGRVQSSFTASFAVDTGGRLVFATVAEGRLWVAYNVSYDETAVAVVDPSTGRALTTMRFGGFVIDVLAKPGDLAIRSGLSGLPFRVRTMSSVWTLPPASFLTGTRSMSRPRWPWTARRCGSPPAMSGCTASTSPPEP
jgi:hypothetical protein